MLAAALAYALSVAHAADLHPDVAAAEELWDTGKFDESIAALDVYLKASPDDPEALWRQARNIYDKGELMAQTVSDAQRLPIYKRVEELSVHMEEVSPGHGEALLWHGVALGRVATTKGILSQLFVADDIERMWLAGLKSGYRYRATRGGSSFPGDLYNALGQFYRLCPDFALMKLIAGTRGDIEKSIEYQRKAVADEPERIEVLKELGVSLLCKGEKKGDTGATAEGRIWLRKALSVTPVKPSDRIDHQHIPIILERYKDACGYSRDGWEDISQDAYDQKKSSG